MIGDRREHVMSGMLKRIRHRGPDDEGYRLFPEVGLGSVRLSIVDPSGGTQPMSDSTGETTLVYNGELYGYSRLREELEKDGYAFRSHSDTEVVQAAFRMRGLGFMSLLNGMFACALYDARHDTTIIVRDPFGIKPVLYTVVNQALYFASEAKAFKAIPEWNPQPDANAWHAFMNVRFTPRPLTLFKDVFKLPAGSYMIITKSGRNTMRIPSSHTSLSAFRFGDYTGSIYKYYDLPKTDLLCSERDASAQLGSILEKVVADHLVADTPVGVFLSGGLDSSTIAHYTTRGNRNETVSICLGLGERFDENNKARNVADALGTRHFDIVLDQNPFEEYRRAVYHMEEPKVNCLQGWYVSREARRRSKAMLSGLGADELFGGYDIYHLAAWLDIVSGRFPRGAERVAGGIGRSLLTPFTTPRFDLYRRMADLLRNVNDPTTMYLILRNAWDHDTALVRQIYSRSVLGKDASRVRTHFERRFPRDGSLLQRFMRFEFENKMVDDFLMNEDRMSMAHGLETRVPFLDRRVAEFALGLPDRMRIRFGTGKWLLRTLMRDSLPKSILTRRKHGFTFDPVSQFQSGLGPYLRKHLTRERVNETGLFEWSFVRKILEANPHPNLRHHYFLLWQICGFILWHEIFVEDENPLSRHSRIPRHFPDQ